MLLLSTTGNMHVPLNAILLNLLLKGTKARVVSKNIHLIMRYELYVNSLAPGARWKRTYEYR